MKHSVNKDPKLEPIQHQASGTDQAQTDFAEKRYELYIYIYIFFAADRFYLYNIN